MSLESGKIYTAQIRYHGDYLPCTISGDSVTFEQPVLAASGQSVVLFDGDLCIGGGILQ
ncbi:tRNA-specific 2-thiouridylase MnmA [compost metagenome]